MHKHTHILTKGSTWLAAVLSLFLFLACTTTPHHQQSVAFNDAAYAFHFRNLDSTHTYALRALQATDPDDNAARAEALNHLAFYYTAKMDYDSAKTCLDSIAGTTDNEIELLVADVQQMRLCQRQSHNKEFYDHYEIAKRRLQRIDHEGDELDRRSNNRLIYARSEMAIVASTYFYYVGLEEPGIHVLLDIDPEGEVRLDTAQLVSYLYNVGAGGIINRGTPEEIAQQEFDRLLQCYTLAHRQGYVFWEANALQSMGEHLNDPALRDYLLRNNFSAMRYINTDQMPDSLLAGNLAQRSLDLFRSYGDVYQTAGGYRTLATCYWQIHDYESALICLQDALFKDLRIEQAPELVSSIYEQLSLVYSAVDNKPKSDECRNRYLDLHQQTRQDRYLESRAEQLDRSSALLSGMIIAILAAIALLATLLVVFNVLRERSDRKNPLSTLLQPLEEWRKRNNAHLQQLDDRYEELQETQQLHQLHIDNNKRRNLEQRAKISLVNSITPFIDRMLHEIKRLRQGGENPQVQAERYRYITEIVDKIDDYNRVLTQWIQLRQGQLSLHIESFPLQEVFDIVKRSQMSFRIKGLSLTVEDTADVVKADRVLTLFMINTMADNARKFTPEGGSVTVSSTATADYVEISIADTGQGLSTEELATIFDHKVQCGHGFGLMNCKGIIEKYKKISLIFSVCRIAAESTTGQGSRFSFRLPKGVARLLLAFSMLTLSLPSVAKDQLIEEADRYADSAYFSNIAGTYERTLLFADTCRQYLNRFYLKQQPKGHLIMRGEEGGNNTPAEVEWLHSNLPTDYNVILDMRNESAVAALALHQWDTYNYNNKVYVQLFKEVSADRTLGDYCRQMQRSETNKSIAIVMLVLVLLLILPAYYVIYYRHVMHYRYCVERVRKINELLLSDRTDAEKLQLIAPLLSNRFPEQLQDIVSRIIQTLEESVRSSAAREEDIELAEDECRRMDYENGRLYVSNAILDNCLSTLKHETMYYPSRIRQVVQDEQHDLTSLDELANYYKELYTLLSLQAMRQVEATAIISRPTRLGDVCAYAQKPEADFLVMGEKTLLRLLFDTLQKQNQGKPLALATTAKAGGYLELRLTASMLHHTIEECQLLFTPSTTTIPYLLCRQVMRDLGESTNQRASGITAENDSSATTFVITLPYHKQ